MAADLPEVFDRFDSIDEVKQFVVDRSVAQFESMFGQQVFSYGWDYLAFRSDGMTLHTAPEFNDAILNTSSANTIVSSTNVQVAGVDEADTVETDGEHIFLARGTHLTITSALPADDMRVLADLELPGVVAGEFLAGDRLTVITSEWHWWNVDPLFGRVAIDALPFSSSVTSKSSVTVTVFDVSDASSPRVIEQTKLDGSYVNSRAIEDKVFVTISNQDLLLPPPRMTCDSPVNDGEKPLVDPEPTDDGMMRIYSPWSPFAYSSCVYETRDEYLARITPSLDAIVAGMLPQYTAWNGDHEFVRGGLLHEPSDIIKPLSDQTSQLTSIVAFDVFDDQSGPVAAEAIPTSWSTTQYATADHLYFFESEWLPEGERTKVLQFDWNTASGEIHASAKGVVEGALLNQFSADEFDGTLRLATTRRTWNIETSTTETQNSVQILKQIGSELTTIGDVDLLAPGESIRSVRFDGDTAFVVTFRQIDPLFTVDLSDPTNPEVLGELKIPGFSGYLQMLDDTHVLGIGRSQGAMLGGMNLQVSLFDVSDLANPVRTGEYTFDSNIWGSTAEWDSHAVNWMPDLGLLAIPVSGNDWILGTPILLNDESNVPLTTDPTPSSPLPNSGLAMLRLDLDGGGDELSDVALLGIVNQYGTTRSVRIGSTIYGISDVQIVSIDAADPTVSVSSLALPLNISGGIPNDVVSLPIWFGTPTAAFASSPGDTEASDPVDTPSTWDDTDVTAAVRAAMEKLASDQSVSVDQIRLITAEATSENATGSNGTMTESFNVVLGIGLNRYHFRVTGAGETATVELVSDQFSFPSDGLQKEWHNADEPCDINGDNVVAPLDALIVINALNSKGSMPLRSERPLRSIALEHRPEFATTPPDRFHYDASGDDFLSPIDALFIINRLNGPGQNGLGQGEGESNVASASTLATADLALQAWLNDTTYDPPTHRPRKL